MKTITAMALATLLTAALCLLPTQTRGLRTPAKSGTGAADQNVARKRAHFRAVVKELSKRDVSRLDEPQRQARTQALADLEAYAADGRFPVDERYTGFGVPYLIDDHGTRCALAHLVDQSGAPNIVTRLAKTHNHAFIPGLMHDRELGAWLTSHGLTVEEAAYIQLPPFTDDGQDIEDLPEPAPERSPDVPQTPRTTDAPPADSLPSGGVDSPTTPSRAAAPTWQTWWNLNRQDFVDLRTRYHAAAVTTPKHPASSEGGHRPSAQERDRILAPILRKLTGQGKEIGGAALMALARMGRTEDAALITEQALAYVRESANPHRGLMFLAIGLAQTDRGAEALAAIVQDTNVGRQHVASRGTLPEHTRAFAAIALGLTGQDASIDTLLGVLAVKQGRLPDLRAACVASLGHLARTASKMQRTRVRAKLVDGVRTRQWHDDVLAAVPAALLRMRDQTGLATLSKQLGRFRKPQAVRESLALALGASHGGPLRSTVDLLLAAARRDPDPLVRRYAIVGLGQRAPAAGQRGPEAVASRRVIGRFFLSALEGHQVGNADRPWVYLGAALYARHDEAAAAHVRSSLEKTVSGGGARGARAAAAIALGLLGGTEARDTLRTLLEKTRDGALRPYLAEALGLLGDRVSRKRLLALVERDASERVRYRAALGLGYMADRQLVGELIAALQQARSVPVRAALTRIIGELGDRRAIAPLIAVATDTREDVLTRGRAIAALGLIGETTHPSWVESFKRGANRGAATPTLRVVLSLF